MATSLADVYMFKPSIEIRYLNSRLPSNIREKLFYVRIEPGDWNNQDKFCQLVDLFTKHLKTEFPFDILEHAKLPYTFDLESLKYTSIHGAIETVLLRQVPDCTTIVPPDDTKPIQLNVSFLMQEAHEELILPYVSYR